MYGYEGPETSAVRAMSASGSPTPVRNRADRAKTNRSMAELGAPSVCSGIMKQFFLGLSFSGVFILGCLTATYAPEVASPTAKASTSAERYKCSFIGSDGKDFNEDVNEAASPDWKLVAFGGPDSRWACFERM